MRVLCYVQPQRGGGVARHSMEMIEGLARKPAMQCCLFASRPDSRRYPALVRKLHGLRAMYHEVPGRWLERMWKISRWPPLTSRCREFDVIYAPAEVRLPHCGIPSIVTVHDVQALEESLPWSRSPSHQAFRRKWMRWLPQLFAEASRIATVSEFSRQRMVTLLNADPTRIVVVGNGVSDTFFTRADIEKDCRRRSVVVIGGLRLKKGAAATLAVAAELRRRSSSLVVDVYGQHDPEWARQAAGHANVQLHGYVDDAELAGHLRRSVALLFLSPYEGFGIPAVEAMAAGAPAVVANAAALPEVVGDAGIIVDPDCPAQIADILDALATDSGFRERQVLLGRQRANQFTWGSCVDRLVSAIEGVVSQDVDHEQPTWAKA